MARLFSGFVNSTLTARGSSVPRGTIFPFSGTPFTISYWSRVQTINTVEINLGREPGGSNDIYYFGTDASGNPYADKAQANNYDPGAFGPKAITVGRWHSRIARFFSTSTYDCALDGVIGTQVTNGTRTPGSISGMAMGGLLYAPTWGMSSNIFTGAIANIAIFDYTLTDGEVRYLGQGGNPFALHRPPGFWLPMDSSDLNVIVEKVRGTRFTDNKTQAYPTPTVRYEFRSRTAAYNQLFVTDASGSTQTVFPSGITSSASVGAPTITGTITITPTGVSSTVQSGTPTVQLAQQFATAVGIGPLSAVGDPIILPQPVTRTTTGIGPLSSVGTPTRTPGAGHVSPNGAGPSSSVGTPTRTATASVSPAGAGPTSSVGTPTRIPDAVHISVPGIGPLSVVGVATRSSGSTTSAIGAGPVSLVGVPTPAGGSVSVTATGAASTAAAGSADARSVAYATPAGIASTAAVGSTITLTPGPTTIQPAGLGPLSSAGQATATPSGTSVIHPLGIPPNHIIGDPNREPGLVNVSAPGRPTSVVVGTPNRTGGATTIHPPGVSRPPLIGIPLVHGAGELPTDAVGAASTLLIGEPVASWWKPDRAAHGSHITGNSQQAHWIPEMRYVTTDLRYLDWSEVIGEDDTISGVSDIVVARLNGAEMTDQDLVVTPPNYDSPWNDDYVVNFWEKIGSIPSPRAYMITVSITTRAGKHLKCDVYQNVVPIMG